MVNSEKIKSVLMLYKKDKISEYVLERELGQFFGDSVQVIIEKESTTGKESYCVFAVPQMRSEGLRIVFVMDKNAIRNIYSEEEFVVVCERLRDQIQPIMRRYYNFVRDTRENDVGMNAALGFFLSLYMSYLSDLVFGNVEKLPDEDDIMKYADLFTMENANSEDLENAKIKGILSNSILELAKKYVKMSDVIKLAVHDRPEMEKPVFCMGQQEIIKHVTSTFGVRDHKEIPYDYLPKTNQ